MQLAALDLARSKGLVPPKPLHRWPKGKRQPLTRNLADRFCLLISTSLVSTAKLLADNPDLPPFKTLETWRAKFPWFKQQWNLARQRQAEFLIQHCLDLALNAEPKTAHVVRVRFDIYRFLASKFHPEVYGDKSFQPAQTTVNVGIAIAPERISELRTKLSFSRTNFIESSPSTSKDDSLASIPKKHAQSHASNGETREALQDRQQDQSQ